VGLVGLLIFAAAAVFFKINEFLQMVDICHVPSRLSTMIPLSLEECDGQLYP